MYKCPVSWKYVSSDHSFKQCLCSLRSRSNIALSNSSCEVARMSYRILALRSPITAWPSFYFIKEYQFCCPNFSPSDWGQFISQTRDVLSRLCFSGNWCNLFIPPFMPWYDDLDIWHGNLFLRVHGISMCMAVQWVFYRLRYCLHLIHAKGAHLLFFTNT